MQYQQSERNYLLTKVTLPVTTPINELRHAVWGGRYQEKEWLRTQIVTAGGTPNGNYRADLWKQLLTALGLAVSNSIDQNKKTFFESEVNS